MSDEQTPITLPSDWYEYVVTEGVSEANPGIYEWNIEGSGSYIGKYKRIRRPTKEYGRNVRRILNGAGYRRANPEGFRHIHHELAQAHRDGRRIRLTILENVSPLCINERESALITERGALNNPPFGRRISEAVKERIEIYIRKSGDKNLLIFHVPEELKEQLIEGIKNGSFESEAADINFEISVRPEWQEQGLPNHVRLVVNRITLGDSDE